jgi:hypothetical protein
MSQKANKNEPVGEDYGFCFCSREKGAILVIILLGLGLLVPGFMLRLEDVRMRTHFCSRCLAQCPIFCFTAVRCRTECKHTDD